MRHTAAIASSFLTVLLSVLVGCSGEEGLMQPILDEGGIETSPTTPAALLSAHEKAIRDQDDSAYAVLLDEDFEFDPLDRDEVDWPWFDGFWGRAEELSSIGNMFDPSFAGVVNPIETIECEVTAIGEPVAEGDLIHIACNLRATVLTSQNDGWSFDTMLEMTLVRRGDVLRIRKVAESDFGGRFDDGGVGLVTWGRMKALFYTEPPGL